MEVKRHKYFAIFVSIIFFNHLIMISLWIRNNKTAALQTFYSQIHRTTVDRKISSCTPIIPNQSEVTFYQQPSDPSHHYEYRYEFNQPNLSSNASRLILLLTGRDRACIDWWTFSVGQNILSQMRSSGFSLLAICTPPKSYHVSMPLQKNLDAYWIYSTFQIWMNEVYFRRFQHYPRLYLFGVSRGAAMSAILCRVLPVQAQIFCIMPGYRSSLLAPSDHDKAMYDRLILDPSFASWFCFAYFWNTNSIAEKHCPFHHSAKNYFNPVPPTYFVHYQNDPVFKQATYMKIISDVKKDATRLGSLFLSHHDSVKLHVVPASEITADLLSEQFHRWANKARSSQLFYEHLTNLTFRTQNATVGTCWCTPTDFTYFDRHPNITEKWSETKQREYHDYVEDIKCSIGNFCETVCGQIMATHAMSSHHVKNTLDWFNRVDHQRYVYRIADLLLRPLILWTYNRSDLVNNLTYLT